MKLVDKVIVFAFLIFISSKIQAQDVNGKWYGVGSVDIQSSANNYMCELVLIQHGNNVTGYMNYFFRDGYFTNNIIGNFNKKTRELKLKAVPILYYQTTTLGTGVDCMMTGYFILKVAQTESTLTGSFESDVFHAFTAPPIKVRFLKLQKEEQTPLEKIETNVTPLEQETPAQKTEHIAKKQLQMRLKNIVRILDVTGDSVRVDLYDNGEFDYDTVSVFYNNKLVEYNQLLDTKKAISFYVHVDSIETNNDLSMFAENLGLIPPNAGLMVITDKNRRYEINLESNFQKTATVRLRKIKPPQTATK
ncbi:MAG: hypothetical protein ACR2FN_08515 [Chitinophagaceae bacterium]